MKVLLNGSKYLASRREDSDYGERPGVDNDIVVHKHFELAVAAVNHLDVGLENPAKMGRHTDGLNPRHSKDAVADADQKYSFSAS